jgi:hypothetical protein
MTNRSNQWGAPQTDSQVNQAQIADQIRKERDAALQNDPTRHLPTSVDRAQLPGLLGLLRLIPFIGGKFEQKG